MSTALSVEAGAPGRAGASSAPLRVAAIIDTSIVSGPGRQLAALAQALRPEGVELRVIMFQREGRARSPYAEFLETAGVPVTVIPERGRADLALPGRLRRALDAFGPDVVQTHSYKATALVYLLRRLGWTRPWVAFFHGSTTEDLKVRVYHSMDRLLLARADRLVVMSRLHLASFARLGSRARVVHNAVIPIPAPAADAPVALPPREGATLGVIGRLSSEKGVDLFLRAAKLLAGRGVAFTALVAGDGPDRRMLEALRDELGLGERVHFLGQVGRVEALYPHLDLLVIPSRSEGLPNVLLEAMRAGVPAVATSVGAVPEVLDGSAAGVLVPPGDVDALADAVAAVLEGDDGPARRAACREVAERFSVTRRAAEHLRLYRELVAAQRGTGR